MIAAFVLAGVCAMIPHFGALGDPACTVARQDVECGCSECMTWDAPVETYPKQNGWFDIERTNPDGSFAIVGGTWRLDWLDEDGYPRSDPPATVWCFARDVPMPLEGRLYGYRVRTCNTHGCSPYDLTVEYVAAPYAIDHFRPPVVGNP